MGENAQEEVARDAVLHLPLHRQFRYIHEPLPVGDPAIPVLGHEALVATLQERLTYSHGGTFLVTGFRGVGKSTLVLRALAETAAAWGSRDVLLVAHLNVARTMTTDQLLFAIVRRIFEALDDGDLLQRLPRDVQRSLLLAYTRTSLSFTQTQSESSERSASLGVGPKHAALAALSPALSLSGKKTRAQATEAAFLAYSETDVEHDLVRIIHLLNGSEGRADGLPPRRGLLWRRRRRPGRVRVHPVVVLDEIDKLTDNRQESIAELESLLGRLKNVLTARGAHFIVVAGPDLHDQALHDADRGNGVYESVFAWRMYVPCLWEAPERLVRGVARSGSAASVPVADGAAGPSPFVPPGLSSFLPPGPSPFTAPGSPSAFAASGPATFAPPAPSPSTPPPTALFAPSWGSAGSSVNGTAASSEAVRAQQFIRYLRFKARGVPRRLLQEFNAFIAWDGGRPHLRVGAADWARVDFYSHLETIASGAVADGGPAGLTPVAIDEDRWRLGGYHVVDWVLRSEGRPFTSTDVAGTAARGSAEQPPPGPQLDPLLRLDSPTVERLLRHLAHARVLDVVSEAGRADATLYGTAAESQLTYYKLTDDYKRRLVGFARSSESERADLGMPPPPAYSMYETTLTGQRAYGPPDWPDGYRAGGYGYPPPPPYGYPQAPASGQQQGAAYGYPQQPAYGGGPVGAEPPAYAETPAEPEDAEPVTPPLQDAEQSGPAAPDEATVDDTPAGKATADEAPADEADADEAAAERPDVPPPAAARSAGTPPAPTQPGTGAPPAPAQPGADAPPAPAQSGTGAPPAPGPSQLVFPPLPPAYQTRPAYPGSGAADPPVAVLADRYEMRSLIGQGGMGAVYRGRDLLTGRDVAIKVLHRGLHHDEASLARFRREAEVGRRLKHPHIAHTLAALDAPGTEPALIIEFVEGPSLRDLLARREPLPAGFTARVARQLGEALQFIDTVGMSRVDLKPSNVLIHPQRGAVIVDLGLVRSLGSATDAQLTRTGAMVGTPVYMAPEQVRGDPADIRSDLYSLGLLLHHCLTGRPPREADSVIQMMFRIVNEDVRVDDLAASSELRALLRRMTAQSPADRLQSPEDFLAALAATPEARQESDLEAV